ncbi:MAG: AtpZ/AtpI family protein [Propionibacteriaceae bacterium]|nr:AtpZ/AtpI family protein [Propionibacteriaceae bacterium]
MGEQSGTDTGLRVFSILISGVAFYGGLGWVLDRWLQTSWLLPLGIIAGMAAGIYLVIARYGRSE